MANLECPACGEPIELDDEQLEELGEGDEIDCPCGAALSVDSVEPIELSEIDETADIDDDDLFEDEDEDYLLDEDEEEETLAE